MNDLVETLIISLLESSIILAAVAYLLRIFVSADKALLERIASSLGAELFYSWFSPYPQLRIRRDGVEFFFQRPYSLFRFQSKESKPCMLRATVSNRKQHYFVLAQEGSDEIKLFHASKKAHKLPFDDSSLQSRYALRSSLTNIWETVFLRKDTKRLECYLKQELTFCVVRNTLEFKVQQCPDTEESIRRFIHDAVEFSQRILHRL